MSGLQWPPGHLPPGLQPVSVVTTGIWAVPVLTCLDAPSANGGLAALADPEAEQSHGSIG